MTWQFDLLGLMFGASRIGAAISVCADMLDQFAEFEAAHGQRGPTWLDHAGHGIRLDGGVVWLA